jgi:hypothetical protein
MSQSLSEGDLLLGRFRLLRALGPDGPSHLWVAEDIELLEPVALRILAPEFAARPGQQERMRVAARSARRLRHPGIVSVFDFYRDDACCFVAREYVEGGDLAHASRAGARRDQLQQTLDALAYAHDEGMAHGDLKASKLLVDGRGRARIADFGLAAALLDTLHPVADSGVADDSGVAGDVAAFARLWLDLEASAPSLGQELVDALGRMRSERSLEPLQRALAAPAEARAAAAAAERDGLVPVRVRAPSEAVRPTRPMSRNAWLGGVFALLVVLVIAVFFVLPRLVEPDAGETAAAEAPRESATERSATAGKPALPGAASAADAAEARRLLGDVLNRIERLRARAIDEWAPEAIARVDVHVAAGEQAQLQDHHAAAAGSYRQALTELDALDARAEQVVQAALDAGEAALVAPDLPEAKRQFELALRIAPQNVTAEQGVERVEIAEQVLARMAEGERLEQTGQLDGARAAYARAFELDAAHAPAQAALARIDGELAAAGYDREIAQAVAALAKGQLAAADRHSKAALGFRPDSAEARDLRRRIAQRRLDTAISAGRSRAEAFEAKEDWHKAADEYRKLIELDGTQAFAREGFERADRRAQMSERFAEWIAQPALLFAEPARAEARRLVARTNEMRDPGPRLRNQADTVAALERTASTPVDVEFESDGLTDVEIRRVGAFGRFDRRRIPLRPGTYVVLGIRRGFRDVRRTVVVIPGQPVPTVSVSCSEKI